MHTAANRILREDILREMKKFRNEKREILLGTELKLTI